VLVAHPQITRAWHLGLHSLEDVERHAIGAIADGVNAGLESRT
jgi:hypothetical protein